MVEKDKVEDSRVDQWHIFGVRPHFLSIAMAAGFIPMILKNFHNFSRQGDCAAGAFRS